MKVITAERTVTAEDLQQTVRELPDEWDVPELDAEDCGRMMARKMGLPEWAETFFDFRAYADAVLSAADTLGVRTDAGAA